MFFFLGKRMPFLGVIIGVALLIFGVLRHSPIAEVVGCIVIVVGVVRTIASLREKR